MDDFINKLKKFFQAKKEISLAFLFGSQAKGKASLRSDYDIAVWFKDSPSLEKTEKLWGEIISLLDREVDLVVLNEARPTVAWAALRGKRLLLRDFPLFIKLLLSVSVEAEDIQDFNIDLWKLRARVGGGAK